MSSTTVLAARNVTQALVSGLSQLRAYGVPEESRVGAVRVAPGPVITETLRPYERVLHSAIRDANPFFHLVEAIWMLAGRADSATLDRYVRDFGSRFAEPGGVIHGAYGARWRSALGFDQLRAAVGKLRYNPFDRQVVIQMWDATVPTTIHTNEGRGWIGADDFRGAWKDRPCNTHVYLRVRRVPMDEDEASWCAPSGMALDLTVCCRSNDAVWGAHGANAVHFSVLQEYLASQIGVGVGVLRQVSNNYHVYVAELERLGRRTVVGGEFHPMMLHDDRYTSGSVRAQPMFLDPKGADDDVATFMRWHDDPMKRGVTSYRNAWFGTTLERAVLAHEAHRAGDTLDAIMIAQKITSLDWRAACVEWLQRRKRA